VSYNHRLLLDEICRCLRQSPCCSLGVLSQELRVSRRTIQQVAITTTGKTLRQLREEVLLARVKYLFIARPTSAIKELSFDLGYKSSRSFSRAVRRASGTSPEKLRSQVTEGLIPAKVNNETRGQSLRQSCFLHLVSLQ
jgi:AraC-like DNA-binding protein